MAMLLLPRRCGGVLLMMLQLAVTADAFASPRSRSLLAPPRRASLREWWVPDGDGKIVLKDGDPRILFGGNYGPLGIRRSMAEARLRVK